jgi:hypothetical protein
MFEGATEPRGSVWSARSLLPLWRVGCQRCSLRGSIPATQKVRCSLLESYLVERYSLPMSTMEKILLKAQGLPEEAREKLLRVAEDLYREYPSASSSALTLHEAAELRSKLAAWEEDWNAPGMEAYDRA